MVAGDKRSSLFFYSTTKREKNVSQRRPQDGEQLQSGADGEEVRPHHPRPGGLRLLPRGALHPRPEAARGAAHDAQAAPAPKFTAVVLQPAAGRGLPFPQLPQPRELPRQLRAHPAAALLADAAARGVAPAPGPAAHPH
jgi:hypothetical protein